jgi:ketosteroid isomerase-like protein
MKTRHLLLAAITAFCCWNLTVRADDNADRNALRLIRTNYMDAANSGDLSKFKNDLSPDATGVMVTGAPVTSYDDLVAYWKSIQDLIGPGGTYHVAVNTDKTDLFGDVAVSHGTTDETVHLANGTDFHFNSFWTAVCHKENGDWKVLRMQATLDPVHNVFVDYQIKKAELVYGVAGVAVGLAVSFLLRLLLGKGKKA